MGGSPFYKALVFSGMNNSQKPNLPWHVIKLLGEQIFISAAYHFEKMPAISSGRNGWPKQVGSFLALIRLSFIDCLVTFHCFYLIAPLSYFTFTFIQIALATRKNQTNKNEMTMSSTTKDMFTDKSVNQSSAPTNPRQKNAVMM